MKNLTTLLLTFLTIACTSQTPPDVECYSPTKWDSLLNINNTLQVENNQLLSINTAISLINNRLQYEIDSLVMMYTDNDTMLVQATNIFYQFFGNGVLIKVEKELSKAKITISDADNRIYITKMNDDLDFLVQSDILVTPDSTYSFTRLNTHLDLKK